jgi:hypothetical protein
METKSYFISVKRGKEALVAPNWQEQLREIAGVTVQGVVRGRAHIFVDDQTIERVRDKFGETCHIEEQARRSPSLLSG